MERVRGNEPPSSAWEAAALPLSYTREAEAQWRSGPILSTGVIWGVGVLVRDRAAPADIPSGKAMAGQSRFERRGSGEPGMKIAGIERIARATRIDHVNPAWWSDLLAID